MKEIFQYDLLIGENLIQIPSDSNVLEVGERYGGIKIWLIAELDSPMEQRKFLVLETGESFNDCSLDYIGTVITASGAYVYHIFEEEL